MDKGRVNDAAAEARREYYRKWRARNRERIKQYNRDYWQRKVDANGGVDDDRKPDEKPQ